MMPFYEDSLFLVSGLQSRTIKNPECLCSDIKLTHVLDLSFDHRLIKVLLQSTECLIHSQCLISVK